MRPPPSWDGWRACACVAHGPEKNCLALGLAAGFMEPLGSTSLNLVESGLARLPQFLPDGPPHPTDVAACNRLTAHEYERIRGYLVPHYRASARDEPFWRACATCPRPTP